MMLSDLSRPSPKILQWNESFHCVLGYHPNVLPMTFGACVTWTSYLWHLILHFTVSVSMPWPQWMSFSSTSWSPFLTQSLCTCCPLSLEGLPISPFTWPNFYSFFTSSLKGQSLDHHPSPYLDKVWSLCVIAFHNVLFFVVAVCLITLITKD